MKLTPLAPNMTEVELNDNIIVLFSYKTCVAAALRSEKTGKFEYYRTSHKWSKTTSAHINKWISCYNGEKEQFFFDNLLLSLKIEKID